MIKISFSSSFKRAFKKLIRKNPSLEQKFWKKVNIFLSNPYHKSLRTHQLTGDLKNVWSFSVEYDCRVLFYFESNSSVTFVDIGTHDDVY